jgi:phospholipase C
VPAFLISPFVERGGVFSKALDHTCILSFLAERFAGGQPYTAAVAERTARFELSALSLALTAEPRNDVPIPPPVAGLTVPTLPTLAVRTSSENALAFSAAARNLLTAEPLTALHLFSDAGHIIDWQGDTSRRIVAAESQAP